MANIERLQSHAALIVELTDVRQHLLKVIGAGKKAIKQMPPTSERQDLIDALIRAEEKLK